MTNRIKIIALCGTWLFSVGKIASAQDVGDKPPDIASLVRAGQATIGRLGQQAATWTATTQLPSGGRVFVEVLASSTMRRSVLSIEAQGRRGEVLRIIDRDGDWYATEGRKAGKYRPYEAPFDLPTAYFFLGRSEPLFVAEGMDLGTFEKVSQGKATYRTPLTEPLRRQVTNALSEMERLRAQRPDLAANPETNRATGRMRDLLERGTAVEIEIATGLITRQGAADRETEFQDFRWLDQVPTGAFDIGATTWEDNSGDPTANGTDDLLMIAHSGVWRPGMKTGDTDGRLLDLRTGRYRRIPFRGMTSLPGCFLPGRRRVAISGVVSGSTSLLGLYEVDLQTGENRPLGGELLADGMTLMPALSPDGRTLAVLHKGTTGRLLDTQVCLIDLESGVARAIGQPHDMAYPSWLPDSKGLVLLNREATGPDDRTGPTTATIARLDLDGRLTKIREGTMPVLLGDGGTILFQDPKDRTWQTCTLDGGDVQPFAGGLAGYGFPSLAPDGKRIVMMHFRTNVGPEATILPIGGGDGRPATTVPGLWAIPAWR